MPLGSEKVYGLVPPVATKAVELSERPEVVLIFDPPETVTAGLTVITIDLDDVAPDESVTTTVSVSVPAKVLMEAVTMPVTESMETPVRGEVME